MRRIEAAAREFHRESKRTLSAIKATTAVKIEVGVATAMMLAADALDLAYGRIPGSKVIEMEPEKPSSARRGSQHFGHGG